MQYERKEIGATGRVAMGTDVITMRDIYERFGRACETAQYFEGMLATVWLNLEYLAKGWWQKSPPPDEVSSFVKKMDRKTLGTLLKEVRRLLRFEYGESIENQLSEALELRNFLMHEFFKKEPELMQTPNGRHQKLLELGRCQDALDKGYNIARSILQASEKIRSDLQDPERRDAILDEGLTNLATLSSGNSPKLN